VSHESEIQVLKGVSRSFYLTLRLLPAPMRGSASLAYLLARASDTLADTTRVPTDLRREWLDRFSQAIAASLPPPRWPVSLLNAIPDARERRLLEASDDLFLWLARLPDPEAALVREVLAIIIGGQQLDLLRFASATQDHPAVLTDDATLEDYTWRVAGCVGAFWTRLGFHTLGEGFSLAPANHLLDKGVLFGKGLQLVNILRDLPADLATGRCYLPVADPHDPQMLLEARERWLQRAWEWVGEGFSYASALESRRLRAATVLPALLARETLKRLRGTDWQEPMQRIKVPRTRVYLSLARALFWK
jgi:farnesyl-diphosphate farnesyltransferase